MTDPQLSRRSALVGLGGTAVGAISASLLAGAPAAVAATTTTPATIAAPPATPQNSGVERRVSALLRK